MNKISHQPTKIFFCSKIFFPYSRVFSSHWLYVLVHLHSIRFYFGQREKWNLLCHKYKTQFTSFQWPCGEKDEEWGGEKKWQKETKIWKIYKRIELKSRDREGKNGKENEIGLKKITIRWMTFNERKFFFHFFSVMTICKFIMSCWTCFIVCVRNKKKRQEEEKEKFSIINKIVSLHF